MSEDLQRPAPLDEHPLRRRTYRVPTPSIAALRALVDECLFLYISGALVHGRPRMGKSYAIEFLRHDLEVRHPKLSVYKVLGPAACRPAPGAGRRVEGGVARAPDP